MKNWVYIKQNKFHSSLQSEVTYKMGLLLQLLLVTTLVAVLHSAPLDQQSESTTVGIKPLPAVLSKSDESKESDEDKTDIKRVSRETPPKTASDSSSLSTSKPPTVDQKPPETRKIRGIEDPKPPPPPPPADPAHHPPPPPPPAPCAVDPAHKPPPPPPPAVSRPVRDTQHPGTRDNRPGGPPGRPGQGIQPLPGRVNQGPNSQGRNGPQNGRHVRDVDTPVLAGSSTTESTASTSTTAKD